MCSVIEKRYLSVLFGLVLFSFLLKLIIILNVNSINNDGVLYIGSAIKIAEGDFAGAIKLFPMPLYSFLICGFNYIFHNWLFSAQFINVVSLSLTNIPLYLLSRRLFDEKVAFWTVLLFSLSPNLNKYASIVIRDPLFILFFSLAILLGLKAVTDHRLKDYVLCGVMTIIAFFFRIEAVLLPVVLFVYLLILYVKQPDERPRILKGSLVFFAPPVIGFVALGVFAFTSMESFGRLDFVAGYVNRLLSLGFLDNHHMLYEYLKNIEANWDGYLGKQNLFEITRHYIPVIYLIGAIEAMVKGFSPLYLLLACIGLYTSPRFNRAHYLLALTGVTFFMMAYYRLFEANFIVGRLFLVSRLMIFPWVGLGLQFLLSIRIERAIVRRISLALLVLLFIGVPVGETIGDVWKQDNLSRTAGEWFAQQEELQKLNILSTDSQVMFFAGRLFVEDYVYFSTSVWSLDLISEKIDQNGSEVIVLRVSKKQVDYPDIQGFTVFKEFPGDPNRILFYKKSQ